MSIFQEYKDYEVLNLSLKKSVFILPWEFWMTSKIVNDDVQLQLKKY